MKKFVRLVFVWRQLEFAFFGAVTPVAALFDFRRLRINYAQGGQSGKNCNSERIEG